MNDNEYFYEVQCRHCNKHIRYDEFIESIHRFKNGAFHIRAECPYCKSFVKYLPYKDSRMVKKLLEIAHLRKHYEEIPKYVAIYDDTTQTIY